MPNNDDPIQSYGENKVSKLFQSNELKGKRESKYEYSGEDSIIEEYNETYSNNYNNDYKNNYSTNRYKSNSNMKLILSGVFSALLPIVIGVFFMILALTMNTINEKKSSNSNSRTSVNVNGVEKNTKEIEYEEEYNKYNFSRLKSISFDKGEAIPTLFKYETTRKTVNYQKYTYSDKRFGDSITTVEIVYEEEITDEDQKLYMQALERKSYVPVEINDEGEYIIVKDDLDENVFMVVILGKNRVVYGIGNGRVSDFLN
ncbi:MAG: hypothetical protein IJW20_01835 [Clostridia bacterium]|nr:hypothetical protein [Clostridia bacterium]